jgi:antitoxin ParD1/3/4
MNVSLTPELERLVNDKVKSGMYQTASEVMREGLRLLKEKDLRGESLRNDVQSGFLAADEGEFSSFAVGDLQRSAPSSESATQAESEVDSLRAS